MNANLFRDRPVAVIGAGVMGLGIVQVALLAGHPVRLFDAREGAAAAAAGELGRALARLADKGKLAPDAGAAALARLRVAEALADLHDAALVVEAIVEDLAVKRGLLRDLEAVVAHDCVLASNTSSLSITALARGLRAPGRVVGMHFFNPVPVMRLVEVVSGLATEPAVADAIATLARGWGKVAVHAKSTPGFIVNRIARPFYAETLALLQEQAATPAVLDACLRGAGFRMGPCELMDLIGHDTNFAVTQSVYDANFQDKRYQPSLVQRELVDGGRLGRKSGRGFYPYPDGGAGARPAGDEPAAAPLPAVPLVLCGSGPVAELLAARLAAASLGFVREDFRADDGRRPLPEGIESTGWPGSAPDGGAGDVGLRVGDGLLLLTDGRCATERAAHLGVADVALFDWPLGPAVASATAAVALAWSLAAQAAAGFEPLVAGVLRALGWLPQRVADVPGLVVARTIAMLVNEAADAVEQGVCDAAGADAAMTLGVNYPAGPFDWLAVWGAPATVRMLDALDAFYRGERYRVSPRLRRAAWTSPDSGAARPR